MADRSNLSQMLRFVCVGVGVAALFMLLTYALVSGGAPPFWASVLAYVICFVLAYLLQRFWTFEAKHPHREALPRYFALQGRVRGVFRSCSASGRRSFRRNSSGGGRACSIHGRRPELCWIDAFCLSHARRPSP